MKEEIRLNTSRMKEEMQLNAGKLKEKLGRINLDLQRKTENVTGVMKEVRDVIPN